MRTVGQLHGKCSFYVRACQVRATGGDSGLCCCVFVMYFERN